MEPAIVIQSLSKQYKKGAANTSYVALRDVIANAIKNRAGKKRDYFWALENVNLEIEQGSRFGIIGRNGAGKSTLLKILSRITPPTKGRAIIEGRVASLLEVGTGFHPELTGRENIFLNGSILGLQKSEISQKLEEIIDFSGVEKFIDTPLKHYSSGMQLRLAFSVAAHLEAEILLIDEVLAVGDMEFQQKCLKKMKELSRYTNRTIVFVSHDLNAIANLTDKCVLLDEGKIEMHDSTPLVIKKYLNQFHSDQYENHHANNHQPYFKNLALKTSDGHGLHSFGMPLEIEITLVVPVKQNSLEFSFQILNETNIEPVVYNWFSTAADLKPMTDKTGLFSLRIRIPSLRLYKGNYFFKFFLSDPRGKQVHQVLENILPFHVAMKNMTNEWGWQDNVCRYIEQYNLIIEKHEQLS